MQRRVWATVVIILILVASAIAIIGYAHGTTGSNTIITTTTTSTTTTVIRPPVGAFLYLWYGNPTGSGGFSSPGWNSTSCPGGGTVVDSPNIGRNYASDSNQTFQTQVSEMQKAGFSFAIVSWWGPFNGGEAGAVNKATLDLFRYLKATNSTFRIAIMIDAFAGACGLQGIPMSQVYDYVESSFATPYS